MKLITIINDIINEGSVKSSERVKLYDDDQILIVAPLSHTASCKYGANTPWCSSVPSNPGFYDDQMSEGVLVFIINKRNNDKLAIHYNHRNNKITYWDKNNQQTSKPEWMEKYEQIIAKYIQTQIQQLTSKITTKDTIKNKLANNQQLNPDETIQNGNLNLKGTNVTSLHNLEIVNGSLFLSDTPIQSLGNLKKVSSDIYLNVTKNIKSLENLESVGHDLILRGSNIESLGNLKYVGGNLEISNTPLSQKYSPKQIQKYITVKGKIY